MNVARKRARKLTNPDESFTGRLEWQLLFAGSRSERRGPVLVTDEDRVIPLFVVGDNPFVNETLEPLEGKRLGVEGTFRNRTLRVAATAIQILEDAADAAADAANVAKDETAALGTETSPHQAEQNEVTGSDDSGDDSGKNIEDAKGGSGP